MLRPSSTTLARTIASSSIHRPARSLARGCRLAAMIVIAAGLIMGRPVSATNYYWTGVSNANWNFISGFGTTNWSTSTGSINDPSTFPGASDVVNMFGFSTPNFTMELGQNFSINGLNFLSGPVKNTSAVINGTGGFKLTLGSGGLTDTLTTDPTDPATLASVTINANVSLAASQTWSNFSFSFDPVTSISTPNPLTVNGVIDGAAGNNLSIAGGSSTVFTNANTYSGSTSVVIGSLTLSGNGSILNTSAVNLGAGTNLILDNTSTNVGNRIADGTTITSKGGIITLNGNAAGTVETVGTLGVASGASVVAVNGSGSSLVFGSPTINSLNRTAGGTVNFVVGAGATVNLPKVTLVNGIIGGYAVTGTAAGNNLNWATTDGSGNVIPFTGYVQLTADGTGTITSAVANTDNTQYSATSNNTARITTNTTINSLYLTGGSTLTGVTGGPPNPGSNANTVDTNFYNGITFGTGATAFMGTTSANARQVTLTIGAGGIISSGATGIGHYNNKRDIGTMAFIGYQFGEYTGTGQTNGPAGTITVPAGVPDLSVYTASDGNLRLASQIVDTPVTVTGTFTASTTANSNIITLTSGDTSQLAVGESVRLYANGGALNPVTTLVNNNATNVLPNGVQLITGITDATHFTVGANANSNGTVANLTPLFGTAIGLTKSGPGILDISNGNTQTNKPNNYYTGKVTINEGLLLMGQESQLGFPNGLSALVPDAITFNGGELRTYAGTAFNANRGITLGTRGGTVSYTGGGTTTINQPITGPGSFTLWANGYWDAAGNGSETMLMNSAQNANNYQGATNLWMTWSANPAGSAANMGVVRFNASNQIPSTSAVNVNLVDFTGAILTNPAMPGGTIEQNPVSVDLNGTSQSFGSLAGGLNLRNLNGTLTLGGNNLSTTFTGSLYGGRTAINANADSPTTIHAGTGQLVKNGTGTQTITGNLYYSGATTINGGTLRVNSATSTTLQDSNAGNAFISNISPITVNATGTLAGSGTINATVTVNNGGALAPSNFSGTTPTTLTISRNLTMAGGSSLNFLLGPSNGTFNPFSAGDLVSETSTGNVALNNASTKIIVNVNPLAGFGPGIYDLVDGTLGTGTFTVQSNTNFILPPNGNLLYAIAPPGTSVANANGPGNVYTNAAGSKQLVLVVQSNPNPLLIWTGSASNVWNTTSTNWATNDTNHTPTTYKDGAALTFDQTGSHTNPITLGGVTFKPSALAFNNNTFVPYSFTNGTLADATTGATGLTKTGLGTVTFNNTNNFTGATFITGGGIVVGSTGTYSSSLVSVSGAGTSFTVQAGGSLSSSSSLSLATSGVATFSNASQTITSVLGDSTSTLTLNGTALTLASGVSSDSGQINGTGSLSVNGATANVTLSGNNGYGGGTSIAGGGTLVFSAMNNLGTGTTLGFDNGTLQYSASAGSVDISADTVTISAGGANINTGGNAVTYLNSIGNGGAGGLTKSGTGSLTLSVPVTYSGSTTVAGGTLAIGTDNVLNTAAALAVNGGTFDMAGHNQQVTSLSGTAAGIILNSVASSNSTLTVNGSTSTVYPGSIRDGAGTVSLTKTGSSTLSLNGVSSFSGPTTITSGVLVSNTTAIGTSTVTLNGGTFRAATVTTSSIAGFGGTSTSVGGAGTGWTVNNTAITSNPINNDVLTLTDGAGGEARSAFSNALRPAASFNAAFTYTPSNTPDLSNAADGVVFIVQRDSRGVNAIGGTGGGFAYTSENSTNPVRPSVAVALNIYNGHVIGTNLLTNGNPNGDTYLPVTPVNLVSGNPIDVSLSYDGVGRTLVETLNEENTTNTFTQTYTNVDIPATLGTNVAYVGFGGGTGGNVSTQTISNFTYTGTATSVVYANNVVLNGGTTSTIDIATTASAPTVTMGTLSVGSGVGTTLNVTASTIPLNQSFGLTLGATTLAGNVKFNVVNNGSGTGTLTLGAVGDGGTNSSITKTGAGILVLTAGGTYGGDTTVNGGTLRVTNSTGSATGSGNVNLAASTTLAGTGAISGISTLSSGAHLAPGGAPGAIGTITLGATNLNDAVNLDIDLGALSTDRANVGALALGSTLTVNLNVEPGFPIGTYTLVSSAGITGTPTFTVNHSGAGDHYAPSAYVVSQQGNNIVLNVNVASQKWTGAAGSGGNGDWDTATVNWDPAVNGGVYLDNTYNQVFDDTGTNTNITITPAGGVSPAGVTFANNTVPYTISGSPINGGTVVVIKGPGTVNLNSSNGYTGGTNLLAGTLNLGNSSAIGTGPLTIAGGSIDNTSTAQMTLANNNAQTWAGNFTFVGSNVDNTHDLNLGTGPVTLTATPTVSVAGSASTLTVGGSIGDLGAGYGLTKAGAGTLVFAGANTYSGTTTVANGNLTIAGSGSLGGGSAPLVVSGGTLDLGGTNQSVAGTTITAGTIQNGTLTATSILINNAADLSIPANLAGTALLTKTNSGTATLSGTNTYLSGTTITGGTLSISSDGNLGLPATLTLNGGTLRVTATTTLATGRSITLGASNGTISIPFTAGGSLDAQTTTGVKYSGVISGPGGLTITGGTDPNFPNDPSAAPYLLVLNGQANTYAGPTIINNATVANDAGVTGGNMLPATTVLTLINNGVYSYYGNNNGTTQTIAGLIGDSTGRIGTENNTTATSLTINTAAATSYEFDGLIQDTPVLGRGTAEPGGAVISVIKNGAGTQIFGGANIYRGDTTVNAGTLTTAATGNIGDGVGQLFVNNTDSTSTVVNLGNNQLISGLSGTITGTGTVRVNVAAGVTLSDQQFVGTATINTTYPGSIGLAAGATPASGGTLAMTAPLGGTGTLEVRGAPSLGNNSNINVTLGSTLRFNVTAGGPAVIGSGVLATVSDNAVLELAGTVAALSDGTAPHSANVLNNSVAAAGLHVTGTNQRVGAVDGSGTTQVEANSSLTANHIVQATLAIGGTDATHLGLVTIDASDASGNPLASGGGLALAGSLAPSDSFGSGAAGSSSLASDAGGSSGGAPSVGGNSASGSSASVPEPSSLVLVALAALAGFGLRFARRRRLVR